MPKLHYFVVVSKDGWDPYPVFCEHQMEAKVRGMRSMEATGTWKDEPRTGFVDLKVVDGKIFFKWIDPDYNEQWSELKE